MNSGSREGVYLTETYRVVVLDLSHLEGDGEIVIEGFPTFEEAREFARRRTRDSLEQLRKRGQSAEQLRSAWAAMGETAVVVGSAPGEHYSGKSEIDFFIDHPASRRERNWVALRPGRKGPTGLQSSPVARTLQAVLKRLRG